MIYDLANSILKRFKVSTFFDGPQPLELKESFKAFKITDCKIVNCFLKFYLLKAIITPY